VPLELIVGQCQLFIRTPAANQNKTLRTTSQTCAERDAIDQMRQVGDVAVEEQQCC